MLHEEGRKMKERYFHVIGRRYPYFEGWYLKHQKMGKTIAFIPAVHADEKGNWKASIQVILEEGAWNFTYPIKMCSIQKEKFRVKIGNNIFSDKGIYVNIHTNDLSVKGKIIYSNLQKIEKDIMGPFRFCPFMQCNHGIISMSHSLKGSLTVNGEKIEFNGGWGYMESDWGESFPGKYLWTQCNFGKGGQHSVMASAADIPFLGGHFNGCICAVHYRGKEHRLGTYYGARIIASGDGMLMIKQGRRMLSVTRLNERAYALKAPLHGRMDRCIKESPACRVQYRFWVGKKQVFNIISGQASFEQA